MKTEKSKLTKWQAEILELMNNGWCVYYKEIGELGKTKLVIEWNFLSKRIMQRTMDRLSDLGFVYLTGATYCEYKLNQ